MNIQQSDYLSAFGGINFVFEYLDKHKIGDVITEHLPELSPQCQYTWKDIFYSLFSIYLCGGDCIEDLQTHLKNHFTNNPFVRIPSPDTVLRRLIQLSGENQQCRTKRGQVTHQFNTNTKLNRLNISLLKKWGAFKGDELILDYDNTIIFNEKSDSKMSYKRDYGYQPGVCVLNEEQILYVENRNGNSDAKSFQADTLTRLFDLLQEYNVLPIKHFRADAASYQYDVVTLLEKQVTHFYIGCRNSYVESYFTKIPTWQHIKDSTGEQMEIGELTITPFIRQARKQEKIPKAYRLVVKRKRSKDQQTNMFTQDAYEYRAILTNNTKLSAVEVARFYNHRGNMERQFDILKNDFGWNHMPFSIIPYNTVFLCLTALCRNLYGQIITYFSGRIKGLKSTFRIKKFLFRFIILPAKWIQRSRQQQLRIYGKLNFSP